MSGLVMVITLFGSTIDLIGNPGHSFFPQFWSNFIYTISCTAYCSILLIWLMPKIWDWPRILFIPAFFFIVFGAIYLGLMTGMLILQGSVVLLGLNSLIIPLAFGLIASTAMTVYTSLKVRLEEEMEQAKATAIENEHLKRLESEARLSSLQAKLNPHFLFNTLNSLASLVHEDPVRAEKSIVCLSELYRNVLSISGRTLVPVRDELTMIKDYLELETLRFEERLKWSITCPDNLLEIKIPGLTLGTAYRQHHKACPQQDENLRPD